MAACSIFDEDEVCIPTSSGGFKYGLVVESSEYISSDEDDSDDENRVQKGQVKVAWHPRGDETVVSENKVILTDRSLMPGDVVRRLISGEESQRGFVQSCIIKCHVKVLGTEHYIYNIDAKDIRPIQEFDPEPAVTLDSWVGHVMEVTEEITVRFPCGARCKLSNAGVLNLEDVTDKRPQHSEFIMRNFYPGQALAGIYEDYEDATWIQTSNVRGPKCKGKSLFNASVVVEEVKTQSVEVSWMCKGFTCSGAGIDKLKSPPGIVEGEDLKRLRRLDCFEHCHVQIGDKWYYTIKETDTLLHKISPRKHVTPDIIQLKAAENVLVIGTSADGIHVKRRGPEKHAVIKEQNEKNIKDSNNKENCDTNGDTNVNGNVDIDDKGPEGDDEFEDMEDSGSDYSSENEIDLVHSGPGSPATQRRHRPNQYCKARSIRKVKGKKTKKKAHHVERKVKAGENVPIEIWYTFSSCNIMWQDGTIEENVPSPELYPIHHLDDLEFFPGDFVQDNVKGEVSNNYGVIISSDHKERTVMVKWVKPCLSGKSTKIKPEETEPVELSVFDVKDHPDYKFRCGHTVIRVGGFEGDSDIEAVGQVYRIDPEGTIQVWWPNRVITKCYPTDLYIIGEEFQSDMGSESEWTDESEEEEEEEEDESDVSWETENEETATDTDNESKKNKTKQLWTVSDEKKKELDALLDRAHAAVSGLLTMFVTVAGYFFKDSYEVFLDILAIFKRCKEVEKILKSSFFEDEEIAGLIADLKSELRKEKTGKLAKQIAQVYRYRNSNLEIVNQSVEDSDKTVNSENGKDTEEPCKGAEGGMESNDDMENCKKLREALFDHASNIEDPITQIIFDTSLHAAIKNNKIKKPELEQMLHNFTSIKEHVNSLSVGDIIQTVIDSVCDKSDQELLAAFEAVKQKVKLVCDEKEGIADTEETGSEETSGTQSTNSEETAVKQSTDSEETTVTQSTGSKESTSTLSTNSEKTAVSHSTNSEETVVTQFADKETSNSTQQIKSQNVDGKSEDIFLPTSHRTLCIRVCKAINVRLLHVKQEVNRKWLAYKFGCDDNVTDAELFEKMQTQMIDSVESGRGPLQLVAAANSEPNPFECVLETEGMKEEENEEARPVTPDNTIADSAEDKTEEAKEIVENGVKTEIGFEVCSETPFSHHYKFQDQKPSNMKAFNTAVRKEWMLLRTSLPEGILVKAFEDRMDLLSIMIKGPVNTPYEDGLFFFDVQLPANFPNSPPVFHYISFCNERLNPNLYEDGKVCVSLLGTWTGKGNELWTKKSSVLQVLVSIQGLILVPEPYFNEAGYERQRGSQHGQENSRMYNEMAVLKLVQSMTKMAVTPPEIYKTETEEHLLKSAYRMIKRIENWVEFSNKSRQVTTIAPESANICNGDPTNLQESQETDSIITGEYTQPKTSSTGEVTDQDINNSGEITREKETLRSGNKGNIEQVLRPASKGFCIAVLKYIECFKEVLTEHVFNSAA